MAGTTTASRGLQECIQACTECHRSCLETAAHCLDLGGEHASREHQTLLLDCAEICQTSANFMSRGSAHHAQTCGACAVLCDACAQSCESMGGNDRQMTACAEICRRCAESCRTMAQQG